MRILDLQQGSPAWLAARTKYRTASEAPAMMGVSRYQKRGELLHCKATGLTPPVSPAQQALFDRGHATEAQARVLVEQMLGEDLYPVTAVCDVDYLLASFDGITMDETIGFEHKLYNPELFDQVRAGELEPHYYWQLEQQILVGGLSKILFVCSDGTPYKFAHMEYCAVPGRADQLMAGWRQFDADLANYQPEPAKPMIVVPELDALPALTVSLVGQVQASNLAPWQEAVTARIQAISTDLETDADFAVAEKTVKFLDAGEKELARVKADALSQTASISELFATIDRMREDMRAKRLTLDKLVKARKEAIRGDIIQAAQQNLTAHIDAIDAGLGLQCMPRAGFADFAAAAKGKKTIATLREAVDTELARAKIAADTRAEVIAANLATTQAAEAEHPGLCPDLTELAIQAPVQLAATIANRITARAEQAAQLAERERIRAEEQAKTVTAPAPAPQAPVAATNQPIPHTPGPSRLEAANAQLARFMADYGDMPELISVAWAIKTHLNEYETTKETQ